MTDAKKLRDYAKVQAQFNGALGVADKDTEVFFARIADRLDAMEKWREEVVKFLASRNGLCGLYHRNPRPDDPISKLLADAPKGGGDVQA